MIQDYKPSSRRLSFLPHVFSATAFRSFLLPTLLSSVVARSFPLYRVYRSTCCQVQAVDPYTISKSLPKALDEMTLTISADNLLISKKDILICAFPFSFNDPHLRAYLKNGGTEKRILFILIAI
ncbi:hypothetical protein TNCV_2873281 [Trichonephila clavipes]|nr:hypothetical protein TNCV_2873281 [Trichonephila clavipes]